MSYLGQVELKSSEIRRIDVTGSTSATHELTWTPASEQSLIITINGIKQQNNYSISGTTLTLDDALLSADEMEVIGILDIGEAVVPPDDSITNAMVKSDAAIAQSKLATLAIDTAELADDAVTAAKLANSINTEIAANTAKVTNATHTGDVTGATALTIANDAVTVAKMADSAYLANRNMIINGAMQIAQRGTTAAGTTSNVWGPIDRWGLGSGSSFNFDVTASINTTTVNTEDGFASALMITPDSTQTPTGSHNGTIYYLIEGYDAQRLQQGGADAHTFTLSFYAKAVGKTGVYSVCCIKKDASGAGRYQVKEFTVTTSWVRQEITFEADTSALIRNSSANDLNFYFSMACGPDDIVSPTTSWQTGGGVSAGTNQVNFMDSTSNEFHITGVQLEIGGVATPYEHKTYGQELSSCQRYYEKGAMHWRTSPSITWGGNYYAYNTASFKVTKRAAPTIVLSNEYTTDGYNDYNTDQITTDEFALNVDSDSSGVSAGWWISADWTSDAEL